MTSQEKARGALSGDHPGLQGWGELALFLFLLFSLVAVAAWYGLHDLVDADSTSAHCYYWDCAA